ncbi:MAG: UTP--glucose-1-phosphate uridylyltransferase GalU [Chloroflexi bacterium]|nr:UTP--glucose-1-phosphate uridylyltransferase GalU [Chloroflexota bacterium]
MRVEKAVVTAAGWGTRFLPATKAMPKEMIPLVDKPSIQYVVEEAVAAGIRQIIVVTAIGKRAIEDHFDRSAELEMALEQRGYEEQLAEVRRISELADICYIRQQEQLGLGHAILRARALVGREPFAVLLPDDIIVSDQSCTAQMVDVFSRYQGSVVAVTRVAREETVAYGIVDASPLEDRVWDVAGLVEKPPPEEAPSNLAIVGRYILTPEVFDVLEKTTPGKNGEIQLTDGLEALLGQQSIYAYEFEGVRLDTGNPLGFLKASVALALRRPDLGPAFRSYLRGLNLNGPSEDSGGNR